MSQFEKLLDKFRDCRGPFPYADVVRLLEGLGYEEQKTGTTSGSRRCFHNPSSNHLVRFHAPHGKDMKHSAVKQLRENLSDIGAI